MVYDAATATPGKAPGRSGAAASSTGGKQPEPAEDGARVGVGEVAGWRNRLASMDRDLTDEERIDLLRALEETTGSIAAAQAKLSADLDASVREERRRAGIPADQRGAGIAAQIALARRVSPSRGASLLGLAKVLDREMPHTLTALTHGRLTEWRATLLARETACLTLEHRREIDEELCADPSVLEGWGDRRLTGQARALSSELEPDAVVRRAKKAEKDRRVTLRPAPDTMTQLTGLLPVTQGVAVYAALKHHADTARSNGDDRSRGQVMADTLVERVTGQTRADHVPLQVHLVMTGDTLLDGGTEPAVVPDHGTIPAGCARDLVTGTLSASDRASDSGSAINGDMAGDYRDTEAPTRTTGMKRATGTKRPTGTAGKAGGSAGGVGVWLRRLFTDPAGNALTAMESTARRAPAGLARYITIRDQTCRTPWCDAPIRHIDHVHPHARGGPTEASNLEGLCEACNYAKQAPRWTTRVSPGNTENAENTDAADRRRPPSTAGPPGTTGPPVTTITPTGHSYTTRPPAPPGARSPRDASRTSTTGSTKTDTAAPRARTRSTRRRTDAA